MTRRKRIIADPRRPFRLHPGVAYRVNKDADPVLGIKAIREQPEPEAAKPKATDGERRGTRKADEQTGCEIVHSEGGGMTAQNAEIRWLLRLGKGGRDLLAVLLMRRARRRARDRGVTLMTEHSGAPRWPQGRISRLARLKVRTGARRLRYLNTV